MHLLKGEEEEGRGRSPLQQQQQQQPGVLAPQLLWEAVRGVLLQRTQHSEHVLQPAARVREYTALLYSIIMYTFVVVVSAFNLFVCLHHLADRCWTCFWLVV